MTKGLPGYGWPWLLWEISKLELQIVRHNRWAAITNTENAFSGSLQHPMMWTFKEEQIMEINILDSCEGFVFQAFGSIKCQFDKKRCGWKHLALVSSTVWHLCVWDVNRVTWWDFFNEAEKLQTCSGWASWMIQCMLSLFLKSSRDHP